MLGRKSRFNGRLKPSWLLADNIEHRFTSGLRTEQFWVCLLEPACMFNVASELSFDFFFFKQHYIKIVKTQP